jgi:hypothetical protein
VEVSPRATRFAAQRYALAPGYHISRLRRCIGVFSDGLLRGLSLIIPNRS